LTRAQQPNSTLTKQARNESKRAPKRGTMPDTRGWSTFGQAIPESVLPAIPGRWGAVSEGNNFFEHYSTPEISSVKTHKTTPQK